MNTLQRLCDAYYSKRTEERKRADWCRELFAYEWCAECGRDHRHHTVTLSPIGHYFAHCDLAPVIAADGELVCNPERYTST